MSQAFARSLRRIVRSSASNRFAHVEVKAGFLALANVFDQVVSGAPQVDILRALSCYLPNG